MKSKKKKKNTHQRTMGDNIREQKIRDRHLEREQAAKAVNVHLNPNRHRLEQISELGINQCAACMKKKSISKFYTKYIDGVLKKIWPSCKRCMGTQRKERKRAASKQQIIACFSYYGKCSPDSIHCSICRHKHFDSLTLIDLQYLTKDTILSASRYKWLCEHKFPSKLKLKLVCYNCAFEYIHQHSKR